MKKQTKVASQKGLLSPRKIRKLLNNDYEKQFLAYLIKNKKVTEFCSRAAEDLNNTYLEPSTIVNRLMKPSEDIMLLISILQYTLFPNKDSADYWNKETKQYLSPIIK